MSSERLHIAVGVVTDPVTDHVLLSKRKEGVPQGGLWEFPGGKLNKHESVLDALSREMHEELGIRVKDVRPLLRVKHSYPDVKVLLDVWVVSTWSGVPHGREGQKILWVPKNTLTEMTLPEANLPIVKAATLPDIYGITPDMTDYGDEFFAALQTNLAAGLQMLQFRAKQLDEGANAKTLKRLQSVCLQNDCKVLLNGLPRTEVMEYVAGVHLTSGQLLGITERCLGPDYLVAASCHNTEELQHACHIGVDFVVLSPVSLTASHATGKPLGWDRFATLVAAAGVPVYALGGMSLADLGRARGAGAQGIAMMGNLWKPNV